MYSSLKFGSLCWFVGLVAVSHFYYKTSKSDSYLALADVDKNIDAIAENTPKSVVNDFLTLVSKGSETTIDQAIQRINSNWDESHEIMLIESIYFSQNSRYSDRLINLLKKKTGKNFGYDFDKWFQYLWNKNPTYTDTYYEFKAKIHEQIDSKFGPYFKNRADQSTIRLDEVRWGGVHQDGIPPLRSPKMISAEEANYLDDSNIVFGIEVNGDSRAYPKRILAWHEMFVDTVGDVPVAGVYCTLCGTVILYKTEHNGQNHQMGTSGFLYRSNKLMYDRATQSLWSTLEGEPVIGPLVGKGIKFDYLSVVTTTWGEWKKRHPETSVLSLQTGHRRNYNEGNAYKAYFATDELMFTVPNIDRSLKNKDEILSIRLPNGSDENYAISSKFLKKNPIYSLAIDGMNLTVFTDQSGAHRVFKTKDLNFTAYDQLSTAIDENGTKWRIEEEKMHTENGASLERFSSHNAFWFGYKAAFPDTQLIK